MTNLTLDDIARLAGVSRSTVSRVINEHPSVKKEVRQRVLDIIEEHHFHPNAAARTLAMQRSWMIGLILPHSVSTFFKDPYYPNLLMGIAKACNLYGFTLALFLVSTKEDEENVFSRVGRKGFLDGVIVQSGHHGDQGAIGRMIDNKIPLVVVGRPVRSDNVTYIDVDNIKAAKAAVSYLYQSGCRRVATITGPADSTVGIDRLEGFRQAVKEHKAVFDRSTMKEEFVDLYMQRVRDDQSVQGVREIASAMPKQFSLQQNYPNPFNSTTVIRFTLPRTERVKVAIYDIMGREVINLLNAVKTTGTYEVRWNGKNNSGMKVSSGIYFYRMETSQGVIAKKMTLLN